MSHSVTVTRTTTTTTTSAIIINTGYVKTWPGLFKVLQFALGLAAVILVGYYYKSHAMAHSTPVTLFFTIACTFLIGTFLILLACLLSISTASVLPKTIYEVIYHGFAFGLYLAATLTFFIEVKNYTKSRYDNFQESYFTAAVLGLFVTALYLLSLVFALRSYRGL